MKEKKSNYYDDLRKNEWKETANYGPTTRARQFITERLIYKYAKKDSRILDCGCGSGNLLKSLQKKTFNNLSGSDFSDESIKLATSKFNGPLYKINITQENDFQYENYDLIICSEVLEHIENDRLAIRNLYNALNKNGTLILSVPFLMKFWSPHDDFSGHVRRYDNNELEEKLEREGFTISESFGWGSLIYPLYFRILAKMEPSKVMSNKKDSFKIIKIVIAKVLFVIFLTEGLVRTKKRARRIFVVSKKT